MKSLLKKMANAFGYEICNLKMSHRTVEGSLNQAKAIGFHPEVIIDVGVGNGTSFLTNVFPESQYLWIEPLAEFEPRLKALSERFNGNYVCACAGKERGKILLNVSKNSIASLEVSSSYEYESGTHELSDMSKREVDVVTLDGLQDKYNLDRDLLLKLDVQGAELDVLDGARKVLTACEMVILEVSFFGFQKGTPEFFDAMSYMKNIGFVI